MFCTSNFVHKQNKVFILDVQSYKYISICPCALGLGEKDLCVGRYKGRELTDFLKQDKKVVVNKPYWSLYNYEIISMLLATDDVFYDGMRT